MSDTPVTTVSPSSNGELGDPSLQAPSLSAIMPRASAPLYAPGMKPNRKFRRVKPPRDSKVYKAVLATIALKAQGLKTPEIGEILHLTTTTVRTYMQRAHRKGWINIDNFDDPEDQLDIVLRSKTVRNINTVLDEHNDDGTLTNRAVDASLQVAKGTGLLKHHEVVKSDQQTQVGVALKVQVEYPPTAAPVAPRIGAIGGTPAMINGEVVESQE